MANAITDTAQLTCNQGTIPMDVNTYKGYGNIYQHPNWKDFFKKMVSQALLKVNFIEKNAYGNSIQIDISQLSNKSYKTDSSGIITDDTGLAKFLNTEMNLQYAEYKDKLKLFFLDASSKTAGGFFNKTENICVLFADHTEETIPHEFLHSQGLPHTFFANNPKRIVFRAMETHNIMDYSHLSVNPITGSVRTHKKRYYTWYWQWKIANENIK